MAAASSVTWHRAACGSMKNWTLLAAAAAASLDRADLAETESDEASTPGIRSKCPKQRSERRLQGAGSLQLTACCIRSAGLAGDKLPQRLRTPGILSRIVSGDGKRACCPTWGCYEGPGSLSPKTPQQPYGETTAASGSAWERQRSCSVFWCRYRLQAQRRPFPPGRSDTHLAAFPSHRMSVDGCGDTDNRCSSVSLCAQCRRPPASRNTDW